MAPEYKAELPTAAAFRALYDTTGWAPEQRPLVFYEGALQASWRSCSAYLGGELVGFGRVISDGHLHAFITEMIVAPQAQGRGIGRAILGQLLAQCEAAGVTDIQLFCAEGKQDFYRAAGFAPRQASRPGMQYVGLHKLGQ